MSKDKRMGNKDHKAACAKSWERGQKKKLAHRAANELLHQERVANGGLGRRERRRLASGKRAA